MVGNELQHMFVQASDSTAGETSDLDCCLHIPDGADVCYSTVENQTSGYNKEHLELDSHFIKN